MHSNSLATNRTCLVEVKGESSSEWHNCTKPCISRQCAIKGLQGDATYIVRVSAENSRGRYGSPSPSNITRMKPSGTSTSSKFQETGKSVHWSFTTRTKAQLVCSGGRIFSIMISYNLSWIPVVFLFVRRRREKNLWEHTLGYLNAPIQ